MTFDAQLTVINVIPAPGLLVEAPAGLGLPPTGTEQYYEKQEKDANNLLDDAISVCKTSGIKEATTEATRAYRSVVEEIIELATKRKIDLIVIGTRGLGGFRKLLLGSVSSGVVTHAHCNVLVVR
jgi:nucleotide-binding universal stress UspA family protein